MEIPGRAGTCRGVQGSLRVAGGQVFGLSDPDPRAWLIAGVALLIGSVLAMLIPTVRAVRLDPATVIRAD